MVCVLIVEPTHGSRTVAEVITFVAAATAG